MKKYVIGVDVGGSKLLYGLFDDQMRLVRVIQRPTDQELAPDALLDQIAAHIRELMRGAGVSAEEVRGVGAAFPSHIDFEKGVVLETADIYALNNVPVRDMRGYRHMIYVTVATGIGGGLILNGELYRGIHGSAGEIGHMFVSDSTGYPCGCGVTGCVESIASGANMAKYAMDRITDGCESRILDHAGTISRIDMVAVGKAFNENDPLAIEVVERGAEYLGRMFQSLYQIFDINIFVYGGGVMKLGERFTNRIIEAYRRHSQMEYKYPAKFLPAELGDNTTMIGAALLVK